MKAAFDELKRTLKTEPQVFRNSKDRTYLVIGHSKDWDTTKFVLLSRDGKHVKDFAVET